MNRTTNTTDAAAWNTVPMQFIPLPMCPFCQATRPIIIRSQNQGDFSILRKCVCRQCSRRFKIVAEPPESLPEFGKDTDSIL